MAGQDESHTNLADLRITRRDAVPLARGTVLAGRYEVETTLGRGGAGVVMRAYDRELREAVAIKVLHPELSQETRWIERLAREVKLARQLRHPNVCRVFDFEKADGHVFIVMELATGGSLRHELQDEARGTRSPDARLLDARAVAEGLAAIHQAGIAHRDVTPQNVLRMADGRLVVSDFGLATEISQTTASIHGGTIAYMAPEVVRGQRADFSADVWSLGVVVHEILFGARPTWNKASGGAMLTPIVGRTLARPERLAYDVCRACTAGRPGDRPASATEVASWLGGRRKTPRHRARRWTALGLLAAVALVATARLRPSGRELPTAAGLEATGTPADWTDTSTVLATIEGRITCLTSLPGKDAVRFASGKPYDVQDLNLGTGQLEPSPLVPEARKEGCPQLSPDGKYLAYQGYAPDGRAFAFVSEHADGSHATPVVPIADPSVRSDPSWLDNSKDFVIDIDHQHAGVFSLESHRTKVLRDVTAEPAIAMFRAVVGSMIFVLAYTGRPQSTQISGIEWPLSNEKMRFRMAGGAFALASPDGGKTIFLQAGMGGASELWRAEPGRPSLQRVAMMRDQNMLLPTFTRDRLIFVSRRETDDAWRRFPDGRHQRLTHDGHTVAIAPCGRDLIANENFRTINRLDGEGRFLKVLERGHTFGSVGCSPDGLTWYAVRGDGDPGAYRCGPGGCSRLVGGETWSLAVSPNGERLALVKAAATGLIVTVMPAVGGEPREVTYADNPCQIGWSSEHAVWVPRRHDGKSEWVEVDVDSRAETGRTKAGAHDCADAIEDPASPVNAQLHIVNRVTAQIRGVPSKSLGF